MDWTSYRATLANELVITDDRGLALLDAVLPQIVAFAEDRIYQDSDLDFLGARTVDASARTRPGQRSVTIPTELVIIEQASLITPPQATPDSRGSRRITLLRMSQSFVDTVWPNPTSVRAPIPYQMYFSIPSQQVVTIPGAAPSGTPAGALYIVPTVDGEYVIEVRGTFDPTSASAENPNTFLLTYYSSLFFAASMAIATGALKQNYGAQSDSPAQAISWDQQYQIQKAVATKQSQRQHSWGPGWAISIPVVGALPRFAPLPPPQPQQAPAG